MTLCNIQPRQCSARPPEGTLPCIIFTFYLPFVSYIKHTDLSFRSKPYSVPCHLSGSSEPLILDSYSCMTLPCFACLCLCLTLWIAAAFDYLDYWPCLPFCLCLLNCVLIVFALCLLLCSSQRPCECECQGLWGYSIGKISVHTIPHEMPVS